MEKIIQIISGGTTYTLTDDSIVHYQFLDGIGIPDVMRLTRNGPYQEGVSDRGFRLKERHMRLGIFANDGSEQDADATRDTIAGIFKPTESALTLKITRGDSSVRQIECHLFGPLSMPESERVGNDQRMVIPLMAPDPIWEDGGSQESFIVDISTSGVWDYIPYDGSWLSYPVINITGEIVYPSIQTTFGGRTYLFQIQDTIPAGQTWVVDLSYGIKTVKYGTTSKIDKLYGDANAFTQFAIVEDDQPIKVQYTSKTAPAEVEILYYNRYISA
jgi:hypothetical protein